MGGVSKTFALAVTTVSIAITLAILFAWVGPGIEGLTSPASAAALSDEEQVQQIYDRVSPAIAEISVDQENGGSYTQIGFGSGSGLTLKATLPLIITLLRAATGCG